MAKIINGQDTSLFKVLIVDDIPINITLVEKMLLPYEFTVLKAGSGREAVQIIESEHPDFMLLDLMMPDMNGYEVLEHVRKTMPDTQFPIIVLSALSSEDDMVKGFDLGANDYITKPCRLARVREAVETQLAQLIENRK